MILNHARARDFNSYANQLATCTDVASLVRTIKDISATVQYDEQNKVKGDLFEVFAEYFFRTLGGTNQVPVLDYRPTNAAGDFGVDGYGAYNGHPVTVQCKFRSNPLELIQYEEVAKFFAQSTTKYGVSNTDFHGGALVFTTANDYNQRTYDGMDDRPQLIDPVAIDALVKGATAFWAGFGNSLTATQAAWAAKNPKSTRELWKHQTDALQAIADWLPGSERKCIVNVPSGGGKTTIMATAILNHATSSEGPAIYIVGAPRIGLARQNAQNFHGIFGQQTKNWHHICFNSGDDVAVELGNNTELTKRNIRATLEISDELKAPLTQNTLIHSTYHSLDKLIGQLADINAKLKAMGQPELVVKMLFCDEAHNLVSASWNQYCSPAHRVSATPEKMLFFTATNKVTVGGSRGMGDREYFGSVAYNVAPLELIIAGIILPPRLIILGIDMDVDKATEDGKLSDADAFRMMEESIVVYTNKYAKKSSSKIIVTCQGADQAAYLCNTASAALGQLGYERFLVLSDAGKRAGHEKPDLELEKFRQRSHRAIIFQYDIIGEGIDIPDVSAVLILRGIDTIKATQTVGRTLRLDPADRGLLDSKEIEPLDWSPKWTKPYGAVLVPRNNNNLHSKDAFERIARVVQALRSHGYKFSVEELTSISDPHSKDDRLDLDLHTKVESTLSKEDIKSITVEAEELDAVYEKGYKLPYLHIDSETPELRKRIQYAQILIGMQAYGRIERAIDIPLLATTPGVDGKSFDQFLDDAVDVVNGKGTYNISWFLGALSPAFQNMNDDALTNTMSIIKKRMADRHNAHRDVFAMVTAVFGDTLNDKGEPPTPNCIVSRMLDLLPKETWGNKDLKFLDPASGSGSFLLGVYNRLMDGLKDVIPNESDRAKHILEHQIYGSDWNVRQVFLARCLLLGGRRDITPNVECRDSLRWKTDMKFDVIVGNPPYNVRIAKADDDGAIKKPAYKPPDDGISAIIYENFAVKCVNELRAPGGKVVLVYPDKWMQLATHAKFREWCGKSGLNRISLVNVHDWDNGTDVSTAICAWLGGPGLALDGHCVDELHQIQVGPGAIPLTFNVTAQSVYNKVVGYQHKIPLTLGTTGVGAYSFRTVGILPVDLNSLGHPSERTLVSALGSMRSINESGKYNISLASKQERDIYQTWWHEPLPNFIIMMLRLDKHASKLNLGQLPDILKILNGQSYNRQLVYNTLGITQEEAAYLERKIYQIAKIDGVENMARLEKRKLLVVAQNMWGSSADHAPT